MAVTISDIAKKAGVAVATVSMVLNRKSEKVGIARETREKVLDIAKRMDYRPSFSARSLANGKTLSLGYICGDIDTPYYSEVASKALHQADRKGYNLIISVTEWDFRKERRAMDMLLNGKVDGVLMAAGGLLPGTPEYETVVRKQSPIVMLYVSIPLLSTVNSDWASGMGETIGYLKEKGHRCIGYASCRMPAPMVDAKKAPFLIACERHGIRPALYEMGVALDEAYRLGIQIAHDPNRPSALIVMSDFMATGVINGFREFGLDVPRDMAVVGIDGTRFGEFHYPALTSISVEIETLAKTGVDLLVDLLEGRKQGPVEITLPTKLVIRKSA